ncbi:AmpG family muropeptide MFS transporter [Metallibacterium scheffleri]|uniref:MFS transporter n=2 Tax=root TaxID=1 RepID=A0A4V3UTK4_9GAMM|nr:MFS transporter [Metallibacterium scheffleri]THD10931.1 MFS transporter [Metallibacterium scheffleri]
MSTAHGMRATLTAFAQPAALTLFFFGFSSGLPFLLIGYTLSGWLKLDHVSLDDIGLISYIGLTYSLKFLWSPAVDRIRLPLLRRLGQRRSWLLLAQCILAMALLGMAQVTPHAQLSLFLLITGVAAFAGATQDTVIDAYRIEIAPPEMQGALASTYIFGYRVALIASGAGALVLAQYAGWSEAYRIMAALLLVPIATTLLAREPVERRARAANWRAALDDGVIGPFRQFFERFGANLALLLLAFILLFKISDQMLGPVALPFYLDAGFKLVQVAEVSKLYGVIVGLVGAFAGGAAVLRWGAERCMPWALVAAALSNLLFLLLTWHHGSMPLFVVMISGDNFSTGLLGTVAVAFLSDLTDHRYTATQYALFSSLTVVSGKLIGGLSGFIVGTVGFSGFFIFSCLATLPALVVWFWVRPRLLQHHAAN